MDWIKVEKQTAKKGEVLRLAQILGISRREAFAACVEFFMWADGETDDGDLLDYTPEVVDAMVELEGFARGMITVGWLLADSNGLIIPNFARHNGESAKKRCLATERQRRRRSGGADE